MDVLYHLLILPIERAMEVILSWFHAATGSYGCSIFLLSLLINASLLPLFHLAERWQEAERRVQQILKPKLKEFRQAFSGAERHAMVQTLYRQMGYRPIYAMRSSIGLFLQLPFWIAAYQLLSRYEPLQGASFLILEDLGEPDRLLWGANLLPFVMTGLNVAAAFVYTKTLNRAEQIQPLVLAAVFLVLLYTAPSGLLLYWTFNSLFSLLRIVAYAQREGRFSGLVGDSRADDTEGLERCKDGSGERSFRPPMPRAWLPDRRTILESPYLFALLAGLWPIVFYVSNNWFMIETSKIPLIVVAVSALCGLSLSLWYLMVARIFCSGDHRERSHAALRSLVFVSVVAMAYLLRRTLMPMAGNNAAVFLVGVVFLALAVGWLAPRVRLARLNLMLAAMVLAHVAMGVNSVIASKSGAMVLFDLEDSVERQAVYAKVRFARTPNVYYIVPDAYPNAEGLKTVFGLDPGEFYERLKAQGFAIYPFALSNYMSTLASMSSILGMDHHYYRGGIGNFEFLNARQFIVSEQNPVVKIFRNNGYQVHYVHETDYLFWNGCLVDSCVPIGGWGEFRDILLAPSLNVLPVLGGEAPSAGTGRIGESLDDLKQTRPAFLDRVRAHIEAMSREETPHFTYIHGSRPGHSVPGEQTAEQLAGFRDEFPERIRLANDEIMNFVEQILTHDPNSVIIVNADHGGWGYGNFNYTKEDILDDVPDGLLALDHLGALLAIRWPDNGSPQHAIDIRTNVNVFPHLFAYLSDSRDILKFNARDDGYLARGWGVNQTLRLAMEDGAILERLREPEQRRKIPSRRDSRMAGRLP
ncbi:MAG TPA: YidC/Oxa1 family membrane protein insertase [Nitrospiraceae bacterium]|nr:YidC/Oxa1 family membrane protein insertase [Nitrospiraceae bacterium]